MVFKHIASLASPARGFSARRQVHRLHERWHCRPWGPQEEVECRVPWIAPNGVDGGWQPEIREKNSPSWGRLVVYVVYPISLRLFRIKYIPGGGCLGFLPARVSLVLVSWLVWICPVYHDGICLLLFLGDSFVCVCVGLILLLLYVNRNHMCIKATFGILVYFVSWYTGDAFGMLDHPLFFQQITLNQTRSVMLPPAPLLD